MSSSHPSADEGRRRAGEFLEVLSRDEPLADDYLAGLHDVRDLAFLGAGLTATARTEGRELPAAQRAQASTRQVHLARLRDANRGDVEGLRTWLRRSGEEILYIRSLASRVDRRTG